MFKPVVVVFFLTCCLSIFAFGMAANAQDMNWQSFRGNSSTGVSPSPIETNAFDRLPRKKWEIEIPGDGFSTPVAYGSTIYLTTAYQSERDKAPRDFLNWLALISTACLTLFFFTHYVHRPTYSSTSRFCISLLLWVLLGLLASGWQLFGCENATYRIWIFTACTFAICLSVMAELFITSRCLTRLTITLGMGISTALLILFPFWRSITVGSKWPFLILLTCFLFPALISLATFVRVRIRKENTVCPNQLSLLQRLAPLSSWTIPLTISCVILTTAMLFESSSFWKVQPTHELALPRFVYHAIGGISILFGMIVFSSCFLPRMRAMIAVYGALLFLSLIVAASPYVVNHFRYLQYQLVRGDLDSWFGEATIYVLIAVLFLVPPLSVLVGRGSRYLQSKKTAFTHPEVPRKRRSSQPIASMLILVLLVTTMGSVGCGNLVLRSSGLVHAIIAIDSASGLETWRCEGIISPRRLENAFNSPATPTPVVNNEFVGAYFGDVGAFLCDRQSGSLIWTNTDLPNDTGFGAASSLCLAGKYIVVQSDSDRLESYVVALSPYNGRVVWKQQRKAEACWRSPISFKWRNREMVGAWGRKYLDLYEANSGDMIRRLCGIDCGGADPVCSPFFDGERIWLFGSEFAFAVSVEDIVNSTGSIEIALNTEASRHKPDKVETIDPVAEIELDFDGPVCSTPSCCKSHIVSVSDSGIAVGISVVEKEICWKRDVGPTVASPLICGDCVWIVNQEGIVNVLSLSDRGDEAEHDTMSLGEEVQASPIAANGHVIIRSKHKLHCWH
jgi:hypothetical protein